MKVNRVGEVWLDRERPGGLFVVVKPSKKFPEVRKHVVVMLDSQDYPSGEVKDWYEFHDDPEWESVWSMERIA